jgi:cytochrome b6-f complex iron-sulfur subunit
MIDRMKNQPKESISDTSEQLPVLQSRRSFLGRCAGMLGALAVVGVVSPILAGCEPTSNGPVGSGNTGGTTGAGNTLVFDVSALANDGESLATTSKGPDGFTIMITRLSATEYAALSMRCTHEGCSVDDRPAKNGPINCFCHGSAFGLDGHVIAGPAPSPLKRYTAIHDAATSKVTITLA